MVFHCEHVFIGAQHLLNCCWHCWHPFTQTQASCCQAPRIEHWGHGQPCCRCITYLHVALPTNVPRICLEFSICINLTVYPGGVAHDWEVVLHQDPDIVHKRLDHWELETNLVMVPFNVLPYGVFIPPVHSYRHIVPERASRERAWKREAIGT